ncbi:MAG: M28 family peptidase [Candidatus Thermoplasmatota archaeon]|nr:M28 family peptidase [Candidatus Thermoplasmatota archaeon]
MMAIMVMSGLPSSAWSKGLGTQVLSEDELAFAKAVGVGEYAYGIDEVYSYEYGEFEMKLGEAWRGAGSAPAHEYAQYLEDEMTRIGLKNVEQEGFPVHAYNYGGASVQVVEPELGAVWLGAGHAGLPGTPPEGIAAEIVYVGLGTRFDYPADGVEGKLVLIEVSEEEMYWLQYPLFEAELHGAVGAVVTWIEYQDVEDSVVTHDSESRTTIPAVDISHKNAAYLKELIMNSDEPVAVKIWCDAEIDYEGAGYNVYGYIPGTVHPDEYIVIGDHYDKWWYGASDDGSGVARLLGLAKAMVDSGYKPDRTIVFVATDAEEYGWTDTEFDWALGAWWSIFVQHPGWAGKVRGYFNLEGGGDKGATSVYAWGTPETQMFRKSLLKRIDSWFVNNEPWSSYYSRSVEQTEKFYTTWADGFSWGAAGVSVMEFGSWRSLEYSGSSYHTQMDTMEWISAESLAMSIISNGIGVIELDRAVIVPYSFQKRVDDIKKNLNYDQLRLSGIDTKALDAALKELYMVGGDLWSMIRSTQYSVNADEVNQLLLNAQKQLQSEMQWVGGYIEPMYPQEHYEDDAWFLREGIYSLEDGNIDRALMWLSWVYGMYTGRWVSWDNYKYLQVDRWNIDDFKQFWGRNRTAQIIDIWHEYDSLLQKKAAGDWDFDAEINSLWEKYDMVVMDLQNAVDKMTETVMDTTVTLNEAKTLLEM